MGPKLCTFRGPSFRKKLGRGPRDGSGWDIQVRGPKMQASLGSQQICPSERYVPGHGMSKNEGVENREAWHFQGAEIIQNWVCLRNIQEVKPEKCWSPLTEGLMGPPKREDFTLSCGESLQDFRQGSESVTYLCNRKITLKVWRVGRSQKGLAVDTRQDKAPLLLANNMRINMTSDGWQGSERAALHQKHFQIVLSLRLKICLHMFLQQRGPSQPKSCFRLILHVTIFQFEQNILYSVYSFSSIIHIKRNRLK